jgi:hypothetical protein
MSIEHILFDGLQILFNVFNSNNSTLIKIQKMANPETIEINFDKNC